MNIFSSLLRLISIVSICISFFVPIVYSDDNEQFDECNEMFNCGSIRSIGYPFWTSNNIIVRSRYCGHAGFELICEENKSPVIIINGERFRVLSLSEPGRMSLAHVDIWGNSCPQRFFNISLNQNLFDFAATIINLSVFYGCPLEDDVPSENRFNCSSSSTTSDGNNNYAYYLDESLLRIYGSEVTDCNISITVPVNQSEVDELLSENVNLADAWNKGFDVLYHKDIIPCMGCRNSGGVCGSHNTTLQFLCFCRDQPYPQLCLPISGTHASSFLHHLNIFPQDFFFFLVKN